MLIDKQVNLSVALWVKFDGVKAEQRLHSKDLPPKGCSLGLWSVAAEACSGWSKGAVACSGVMSGNPTPGVKMSQFSKCRVCGFGVEAVEPGKEKGTNVLLSTTVNYYFNALQAIHS